MWQHFCYTTLVSDTLLCNYYHSHLTPHNGTSAIGEHNDNEMSDSDDKDKNKGLFETKTDDNGYRDRGHTSWNDEPKKGKEYYKEDHSYDSYGTRGSYDSKDGDEKSVDESYDSNSVVVPSHIVYVEENSKGGDSRDSKGEDSKEMHTETKSTGPSGNESDAKQHTHRAFGGGNTDAKKDKEDKYERRRWSDSKLVRF
jgi:hypothetical protein